jgi:hypothetical protein
MDPQSPAAITRMPRSDSRRPCAIIAAVLWTALILTLLIRAGLHPHKLSSFTTYLTGGAAWRAAQPLYTNWRGFVYPPIIAWFFSLYTHLPLPLATILWHLLAAGIFLLGLDALLRSGVFHRIPTGRRPLVFIVVLPLAIGNLDNAQANPLIAGLMMLSVAALQSEAWTLCAFTAALAIAFKIYPIALALLLCLLRPRQLSWRILLFLLLMAVLPFVFQNHHYISSQYHAYIESRLADNRFQYPMKDAPLDLWYLLVRLENLPVSEHFYTALQAIAAIALALFVWTRRIAPLRDILATLFLLVSVWMLLLGPATENQTYVILAPAASLLAIESLTLPRLTRILAWAAFALLLAAVARNSLIPSLKTPPFMAIQPLAALLLLAAILTDTSRLSSPTPASPP